METLEILGPEHVWIADITCIRLRRDFVCLAIIMAVSTRCIRGWHQGRSLDQGLTLAALERALVVAVPEIHHSDQGVQYAAADYVQRLQGLGVARSMAAVGEPRENGHAERLMRTIREEEVNLSDYRDFDDARCQIARFLDDLCNVKRIHSALGYLTPREFEECWRTTRAVSTMPGNRAEDRASVETDPSADPVAATEWGRQDADPNRSHSGAAPIR